MAIAMCKGSIAFGNGCGKCIRCNEELYEIGMRKMMPVGELIECDINNDWVNITVLAKGLNTNYIRRLDDGTELVIPNTSKWKYAVDKEQQKRNEILESWRRLSLDNAHDSESSSAHIGSFINMLIDNGYVEVEK